MKKTINGGRIERGDERVTVDDRTYIRFRDSIQVYEQRPDFMVFLTAFTMINEREASKLIENLRASGCTGKGECHTK